MYYAVKFDAKTRKRLLDIAESICPVPDDWKIYCDHITLIHSSSSKWEKWDSFLKHHVGREIAFSVIGYGKSEKAFAFEVDLYSANTVTHITIACAPGAKPVQSNYIGDWNGLEKSQSLCFSGEIELCK